MLTNKTVTVFEPVLIIPIPNRDLLFTTQGRALDGPYGGRPPSVKSASTTASPDILLSYASATTTMPSILSAYMSNLALLRHDYEPHYCHVLHIGFQNVLLFV